MADTDKVAQTGTPTNNKGKISTGVEKSEQDDFYLEEDDFEPGEDSENEGAERSSDQPINMISLFKGEELTIEQITDVTYRFPATKIYILGEHDSGKTTILATLFEMFQAAPFHDFHYAGSLTQIGFERRCFYSRLASKNDDADTERTKAEEFHFLHIAIKKSYSEKQATHLLISDIAGEKIKRAKSNTQDMEDLAIITDSHHISFVIDGEKLAEIKTRQAVLTQAKTFVRKAIDEKIMDNQTRLAIVVSKWDLLEGLEGFDYNLLIVNPFTRDFQSSLGELNFLKIAVRPDSFDVFKLGHGLLDLLNFWLKVEERANEIAPQQKSLRMINNLIF